MIFRSIIPALEQTRLKLRKWWGKMLARNRTAATVDTKEMTSDMPAACLQTIIDGFEDDVLVISPDFRIKQVNSAVQRRLATPLSSVVGQPCFQVRHGAEEPCQPPWYECPLQRVLETGQSVRVVHTHQDESLEDGQPERWVEVIASPIWDEKGNITEVIELVRDITENKKLQKDIVRANRELLALNSIAHALSQSLDLKVVLKAVAETMLDALEAQVSWVRLSEEAGKATARASRGLPAEAADEVIQTVSNMSSPEETATWASYSVAPADIADGQEQTMWQFAVTPLKSKGVVLGVAGVATAKHPVDQQRIQLLDAIGSQIAVAVERCQLYEEVQLARDLRGELLNKVISAQEEERKRIARELHDQTGQAITALRLYLERLAMTPASNTEGTKAQLAHCLSLCQQADEEVDKLVFDLRPALLDDLGLVEAVKSYAQTRLGTTGVELNVRVTGRERRLSGEKEVALFRVIQEAITNIVKHARAKSVMINLQFKPDQFIARIEDDGCGFEVNQTVSPRNPRRGLGLLGMKERMNLVGGSLSIVSRPGAGTRLRAAVPLDEEGQDEKH